MQYETSLVMEVVHLLQSHGLEVLAVDPEKGEIVAKIPSI